MMICLVRIGVIYLFCETHSHRHYRQKIQSFGDVNPEHNKTTKRSTMGPTTDIDSQAPSDIDSRSPSDTDSQAPSDIDDQSPLDIDSQRHQTLIVKVH